MNPPERPAMPRPVASSTADRIAKIVEAAEQAASAVIDDAEAQARRYLAEAQAEADRVVAERLSSLGDLSESLVAQADAIRRQADRLMASLSEAGAQPGGRRQSSFAAQQASSFPQPGPAGAPPQAAPPPPQDAPPQPPPGGPQSGAQGVGPGQAPPPNQPAAPGQPHLSAVDSPPAGTTPPTVVPGAGEEQGNAAAARLLATQMAVSGASREEIDARLRSGFQIEDTASILDAILGPES